MQQNTAPIAIEDAHLALDRWLHENHGLNAAGWRILSALLDRQEANQPPMTMGDLCATIGIANSTATDSVDRLVRKGWVDRVRSDQDRRQVVIWLTNPRQTAEVRRQMVQEIPPIHPDVTAYLDRFIICLSTTASAEKAG